MADIAAHDLTPRPRALAHWVIALRHAFHTYRRSREAYRHKRAIYLRTLQELQSYQPHELHDLRIDPADFHAVALKQAGW